MARTTQESLYCEMLSLPINLEKSMKTNMNLTLSFKREKRVETTVSVLIELKLSTQH